MEHAHSQMQTFGMSDPIKDLAMALSKFQGTVPSIKREAIGHHRNKYATLDAILDVVRPVLAKHELSIVQALSGNASSTEMVTLLLHSSGQFIEARLGLQDVIDGMNEVEQAKVNERGKLYGMDPTQVIGTVITYARRYAVCSILGLSTEEDIDGVGAREPVERRSESTKATPKRSKRDTKTNQKAMTNVQREKIQKLAQAGGFSDDDLIKVCQQDYDVLPSEVNFNNANHLIERLTHAVADAKAKVEKES